MDREEIIKDYRAKHAVLEAAFFETPEIGREHRKLREGRSIEVFDRIHGEQAADYEAAMISAGFDLPPTQDHKVTPFEKLLTYMLKQRLLGPADISDILS